MTKPLTIETAGRGAIAFDADYLIYVRQYYLHCVRLLGKALARTRAPVNVVVGPFRPPKFLNRNPTYRVVIQHEHTLVKRGGRDSGEAVEGKVQAGDGSFYLVRIESHSSHALHDFVIDYSAANIEHVARSAKFETYSRKHVCIAPLLYPPLSRGDSQHARDKDIIATFIDDAEPRRSSALREMRARGLPVRNEVGLFGDEEVAALYSRSKVLVNVHQTDHHHTLEELRVLPALLCGCLVVSENVPLKETIPYAKYVVWADYGQLAATVEEVSSHYEKYYRAIFIDSAFRQDMTDMALQNDRNAVFLLDHIGAYRKRNGPRQASAPLLDRIRRWRWDR